jgi:hypothetical protein
VWEVAIFYSKRQLNLPAMDLILSSRRNEKINRKQQMQLPRVEEGEWIPALRHRI